jgi:hypothetical protein
MNVKISKTNAEAEYFNRRLDEIVLSNHDRLRAKAQFARAEAMADLISAGIQAVARLFRSATDRPSHPGRPAAHAS